MILKVCPSCGAEFEGDLCLGCPSCGARAVGPPLAKPEHELPSYGRALIAVACGFLMSAGLSLATVMVLVQTKPISLRLGAIEYAGESAAWNLKWVELPIAIAVLWIGVRMLRAVREMPERFTGLWIARGGFYRILRALSDYEELHASLPGQDDVVKELSTLPDPDGSMAEALLSLDPNGYKPGAVLAEAATTVRARNLRGTAFRNSSASTSAAQMDHGVAFTTYELRLPGEDKILGTDDDLVLHDGVINKASELTQPSTERGDRTRFHERRIRRHNYQLHLQPRRSGIRILPIDRCQPKSARTGLPARNSHSYPLRSAQTVKLSRGLNSSVVSS